VALLPFYLPLKIYSNNVVTFIPDLIIIILFIFLVIVKRKIAFNRIDLFMVFFLLHSTLLLVMFSYFKGGLLVSLKHFHNFISGIIFFFLVKFFLTKKDLLIIINIFLYSSLIISFFYIYEWINVNIFKNPVMYWASEHSLINNTNSQFLGIGQIGFYIPAGFIGYSHASGIMFSSALAIVLNKYRARFGKYNLLLISILILATIFTASRVAILSLIIPLFLFKKPLKIQIIIKSLIFLFIVLIIFSYNTNDQLTNQINHLLGSFTGTDISKSIFFVFNDVFQRDLLQLYDLVFNYPLVIFTGAGYPSYGLNVLNPVITNDVYFLMWISQVGLVGSLIMMSVLYYSLKYSMFILNSKTSLSQDKFIVKVSISAIMIFLFSTIHSSSIQAYIIYYMFFGFLAVISIIYSEKKLN
jgi:hypothetical protein